MLQHPKGQILQRYCIASNDEASPIARSYRDDAFRILEANIPAGSRQTGRSGPSTGLVLLPWVGQTVRAVSACQQACVVPYRSPSVGQNTRPQCSLSAIHQLLLALSAPSTSHVPDFPQCFLLLFQLSIGLQCRLGRV
jgi:hypothetical protein